jgi:hypothetical protein
LSSGTIAIAAASARSMRSEAPTMMTPFSVNATAGRE